MKTGEIFHNRHGKKLFMSDWPHQMSAVSAAVSVMTHILIGLDFLFARFLLMQSKWSKVQSLVGSSSSSSSSSSPAGRQGPVPMFRADLVDQLQTGTEGLLGTSG